MDRWIRAHTNPPILREDLRMTSDRPPDNLQKLANICMSQLGTIEATKPALTDDVARLAVENGVALFALEQCRAGRCIASESAVDLLIESVRAEAMYALARVHAARQLLKLCEDRRLDCLVLKGMALAYSIYSSPALRPSVDLDLLFRSRADVDIALVLLQSLGFRPAQLQSPGDLVSFEKTATGRGHGGAMLHVDLHWRLGNAPLFAERFEFDELFQDSSELPKLCTGARGLSTVHAYLFACIHRIQHLPEGQENTLKWLNDLKLLAQELDEQGWSRLRSVAVARGLAGICLDGTRASMRLAGLTVPSDFVEALGQAASKERLEVSKLDKYFYRLLANVRALGRWTDRARYLRQLYFPGIAFLRERHGLGDASALKVAAVRANFVLRKLVRRIPGMRRLA